jgi:hypothetical protein
VILPPLVIPCSSLWGSFLSYREISPCADYEFSLLPRDLCAEVRNEKVESHLRLNDHRALAHCRQDRASHARLQDPALRSNTLLLQ